MACKPSKIMSQTSQNIPERYESVPRFEKNDVLLEITARGGASRRDWVLVGGEKCRKLPTR
jgi:hypothetical protein